MATWHSAAVSHIGNRSTNEDGYLEAPDLRLWAVADGMGGHAHGEVASATALHRLKGALLEGQGLDEALAAANRATWETARKRGSDMGTTLVALRLHPDGAYEVAWLGDSRIYCWDGAALRQLTTDHTVVQDWVAQGRLNADEARHHPYGHVLTRGVGLDRDERPQTLAGSLAGSERFLLCSDGLTDTLDDDAIAAVAVQTADAEVPEQLHRAAEAAANPYQDNLTAVWVYPA